VYVEGGGDRNKALSTRCRQGFAEFLQRAGFRDRMPKIVACGGRQQAYESFKMASENGRSGEIAILLVDGEGPVTAMNPWQHARDHDAWTCPQGMTGDYLHFMVQAMEAWFYADKEALQAYYGQGFRMGALSQRADIESIPKNELFSGLHDATKDCQKGAYSKGEHSFQILGRIDPAKVGIASQNHAGRFLSVLSRFCTS
jgi:hypothetical protein